MICRLLKLLTTILWVACGVTACAQVDSAPSGQGSGYTNHTHTVTTPDVNSTTSKSNTPAVKQTLKSLFSPAPSNDPPPPSVVNNGGGSNGDNNLWDHMRADFQLPASADNPAVEEQIHWYAQNQEYLNKVLNRAAPYMYYILEQTQQRNLPAELVLLPIMESAYNPFANSYRGAAGLWQLMAPTANGYGVKQDWWYDGRRDIYASTNAALDYLTYLQNFFGGDWLLAIAAYDTGEGNVQNAVRRNARDGKPTDFWSLSLAAETQSYVPRLLALAAIINNPSKYGITLPNITDQPYLQQVDIGAAISLTQAAQLAGMSLPDIKALNPAYSHMTTDPNGPYRLLLPIDKISIFKENLANAPSISRTTWGRYKVQKGDTLASIASHFNTTVDEIKDANQLKGHKAPVGRVIMIPTGTQEIKPHVLDDTSDVQTDLNNPPNLNKKPSAFNDDSNDEYQDDTASLDSLTATAAESLDNKQANNSNDTVDQNTPDNSVANMSSTPTREMHVVKHGETLYSIAKKYDVSVTGLKHWNKIGKKGLRPNSTLVIEVAKSPNEKFAQAKSISNAINKQQMALNSRSSVNSHKRIIAKAVTTKVAKNSKNNKLGSEGVAMKGTHYTVRNGDTLLSIAKHLGIKATDLKKWNNLAGNDKLKPGQHIVLE